MSDTARLLLVEDNDADVFLVRAALDESGLAYDLQVCSDGEQALRVVDRIRDGQYPCPDLLLLDLNLPKYSGAEILEHMSQSPAGAACPVMILTSSDSPNDRAAAAEFGVKHYFRKPADLDGFMELGMIIRTVLLNGREAGRDST